MDNINKHIASIIGFVFFVFLASGSDDTKNTDNLTMPDDPSGAVLIDSEYVPKEESSNSEAYNTEEVSNPPDAK